MERNEMIEQIGINVAKILGNAKAGNRALRKEEKAEGIGPGSLGKILRAKILGDPMGLNPHEFKALGESTGSGGGWFVSPALSGYTIDLARNKACVLLAGGGTLPVTTEEMTLVKVLTDPTPYWVAA